MLHSVAYASTAWRGATPWNPPSSQSFAPGQRVSYGVRMVLAPSLEEVESTLLRHGMPIAQPLPTPILHTDMMSAALLLALPPSLVSATGFSASQIASHITATPASALSVTTCEPAGLVEGAASRVRCGLVPRALPPDGRVRLMIVLPRTRHEAAGAAAHDDASPRPVSEAAKSLRMSVHLYVGEPAARLVGKHGEHGATKAWLPGGTADPWHRDGAFFGWDDASGAAVTQERRVYMSGLSDEAGAGAGIAMAVKQVGRARAEARPREWLMRLPPLRSQGHRSSPLRACAQGRASTRSRSSRITSTARSIRAATRTVAAVRRPAPHPTHPAPAPDPAPAPGACTRRLHPAPAPGACTRRLPGSLPGSLPRSLAPSLPRSLPPSLPPSLTPSLTPPPPHLAPSLPALSRFHPHPKASATQLASAPSPLMPPAVLQSSADHSVRLSMLYWSDALNDANSEQGRAATAAAPGLARVCRGCWPNRCSWMDCWSEEHSLETWRAYNYPHVTAVYWSLYRAGRWTWPSLTRRADWQWYLTHAFRTAMALWTHGGDPWTKKQGGGIGTTQWGLMVGSIFELLLTDLIREGWTAEARALQETVEKRMAVWLKMPFPYGSEFAWDSTGHEEIASWMLRFGRSHEARQTLDAVTAYVSLSPHWACAPPPPYPSPSLPCPLSPPPSASGARCIACRCIARLVARRPLDLSTGLRT